MTAQSSIATLDSLDALLPLLATYGLAGSQALPMTPEVGLAEAWVALARSARLTGPLFAAVRDGAVQLPESAHQMLVDEHRQALFRCMYLEQRLLDLDDRFGAASIPFVVVKGPAVAHLDLADAGERLWSDIDVLIPSDHIDRAIALVMNQGGVRAYAEPRPGWDRRFGKSVEIRAEGGVEIDIHRTLTDGVYGERIPLGHLHRTTETFEIAGRSLRALSAPARVLHTAYHATVGSVTPSWTTRRDLARYLTQGLVPVAEVVAEARRWRGEAVLQAGVELVRSELRVDAPEWYSWADSVVVDPHEKVLAARLRHGDSGIGKGRLDVLGELGSARDRVAYLRGLALPMNAQTSMIARYRRWVPRLMRRGGAAPKPGGQHG